MHYDSSNKRSPTQQDKRSCLNKFYLNDLVKLSANIHDPGDSLNQIKLHIKNPKAQKDIKKHLSLNKYGSLNNIEILDRIKSRGGATENLDLYKLRPNHFHSKTSNFIYILKNNRIISKVKYL